MSFKGLIRELKEIKEGIGSLSRRGSERRNWHNRAKSHIAPDEVPHSGYVQQSRWAYLPPQLLLDIIRRVEESETMWPARNVVVFCASVCKTWREVTKEIVKTPEECGRVTFPISLKQPGPRELPIQCFIRRDRATSTYFLHIGLTPSENESDKLLLAARKIRRATCTDFVISLVSNEFSRANDTYVGKLRSNFLGTKFTIYDSQPPAYGAVNKCSSHTIKKLHSRQVSPRLPACNYSIANITYELNVLRTRGPRRIHCVMHSVPFSSVEEGGTAPTPSSFQQSFDESFSELLVPPSEKEPVINYSSTSLHSTMTPMQGSGGPLILKNKAPRWHEQLQCWCLNFRGRVTVASVKNFQLVAAVDSSHNVVEEEKERVILQFGKIGKDIFTMDYRYPLSAFQAFAICLSSFDTKPACE